MEMNEEAELAVHRAISSEIESYRSHLQSQFKHLAWGLTIMFTTAGGLGAYFFGKSFDESKQQLTATVDAKVIDYQIVESFKKRLDALIQTSVANAIERPETKERVDSVVTAAASLAAREAEADVSDKIATTIRTEIEAAQKQDSIDLIQRVSLPKGAVLPFNRNNCPPQWKEYEPAYGRFIRGIDKSGESRDPDGYRNPGTFQGDQFSAHAHRQNPGTGNVWLAAANRTGKWPSEKDGVLTESRTGTEGGSETRPANVALLYCEKTGT